MKKINISNNIKTSIINDYQNGLSIRKLVDKYQYSFTVIHKLINSYKFNSSIQINYPTKDGFKLIARCKITQKIFNDYNNSSGVLTNHIKSIYDVKLPTKYKRKSIEYQTGKFWYDKYFTFEYKQITPRKKCLYCDWETNDVNNLSGAYEKHLKQTHNKSLVDYLNDFPNEKKYFKKEIYDDLVKCEICGKSFKYLTNTHLNKHNITQLEYKIKYGSLLVSNETKNKLKTNYNLYLKKSPNLKTSKIENVIIDNIPVNFIQSDRNILNGKEIDLLYNNIGFEINGVIYHTEIFGKKDRNYHINKTLLANDKNVKLYHI
ncbi:MAG: MucR family transcriptional regulator, partial [bacterium]